MSRITFNIYMERRDPGRNMARFYAISLEDTLFGLALCRRYGRIGTTGRGLVEYPVSLGEALERFLQFTATKRRRGYGVRSGTGPC